MAVGGGMGGAGAGPFLICSAPELPPVPCLMDPGSPCARERSVGHAHQGERPYRHGRLRASMHTLPLTHGLTGDVFLLCPCADQLRMRL